jgi:hypothetical protein
MIQHDMQYTDTNTATEPETSTDTQSLKSQLLTYLGPQQGHNKYQVVLSLAYEKRQHVIGQYLDDRDLMNIRLHELIADAFHAEIQTLQHKGQLPDFSDDVYDTVVRPVVESLTTEIMSDVAVTQQDIEQYQLRVDRQYPQHDAERHHRL